MLRMSRAKDKFHLVTTGISPDDTLTLKFFTKTNNFTSKDSYLQEVNINIAELQSDKKLKVYVNEDIKFKLKMKIKYFVIFSL